MLAWSGSSGSWCPWLNAQAAVHQDVECVKQELVRPAAAVLLLLLNACLDTKQAADAVRHRPRRTRSRAGCWQSRMARRAAGRRSRRATWPLTWRMPWSPSSWRMLLRSAYSLLALISEMTDVLVAAELADVAQVSIACRALGRVTCLNNPAPSSSRDSTMLHVRWPVLWLCSCAHVMHWVAVSCTE